MNKQELNKLTFLCRKVKIRFHTKRIVDHNYAILITEERRTITHSFSTYSLAKEKIDEILYRRSTNISYEN